VHKDIRKPHIGVGIFHPVTIFSNQSMVLFNGPSKGSEFLVDDRILDNSSLLFSKTVRELSIDDINNRDIRTPLVL